MRHLSESWSKPFIALTAFAIAYTTHIADGDQWVRDHTKFEVVLTSEMKGTDIGTRRELFVEETLIESITGDAQQVLHHPTPREIVLVNDQPWEGNILNYVSMIQDGDTYRMYYRTGNSDVLNQYKTITPEVICVALSKDGVHWERPNLGLIEFNGSKDNNIVMIKTDMERWLHAAHHLCVFLDKNPDTPPSERYKATGGLPLRAWVSEDGFDWKLGRREPIVRHSYFDSLNTCVWDPYREEYRIFSRTKRDGIRDILVSTSKTFLENFSRPVILEYTPARSGHLYTNQIIIYDRAPHYYLGFPTRYESRGATPSTKYLADWEWRQKREEANRNYDPGDGAAATEGLFMASRDGHNFRLYEEAFARPGLRTKDTWFYGDMYQARGLLETPSTTFDDAPNEFSLYFNESCLRPEVPGKMRRYTLRLDGFVSIYAKMSGGKVTTRPIRFAGNKLTLNYSSSARGGVRVGFLDEVGRPIENFSLEDCPWIYGDSLERPVEWYRGEEVTTDVSSLADRTVKIVFELKDADLYAYQFVGE
jgi:hypothetical protein